MFSSAERKELLTQNSISSENILLESEELIPLKILIKAKRIYCQQSKRIAKGILYTERRKPEKH